MIYYTVNDSKLSEVMTVFSLNTEGEPVQEFSDIRVLNYRQDDFRSPDEHDRASMEIDQAERRSDAAVEGSGRNPRPSWERDMNRPNRRASQFPCSGGDEEPKGQRRDFQGYAAAREEISRDCDRVDANGRHVGCLGAREGMTRRMAEEEKRFNFPVEVGYNGEDDEFKGYERILQVMFKQRFGRSGIARTMN